MTAGVVPTVRRGNRVLSPPGAIVPTARRVTVAWSAVHWPAAISLTVAAGQVQVTAGVVPTVRRGPRVPPPAAAVPTARRTMVAWRAVHQPAVASLAVAAGEMYVMAGVVPTVRRGPRVPPPAAAVPTTRRVMVARRAMHRAAVLALRIAAGMVQVTAGVVPTVRRGPRVPPPAAAVPTAMRTMVAWRAVHWPAALPLRTAAGMVQVTAGVVPIVRRGPRVPPPAAAVPTARRTMVAWTAVHWPAALPLGIAAGLVQVAAGVVTNVRRGPTVPPPAAAVPIARRTMVAWRAVHRPAVLALRTAAGLVQVTAGVVPTARRGPRVPPPAAAVPTARRTMVAWRAVHRPAVASLAVAAGEMYVMAGVVPTVRRGARVPPPAAAMPTTRRVMVARRAMYRAAVVALRIAAGMVQVTDGVVPTVRRGPRVPPPAAAVPTARRTMVTWRAVHRPAVASLAVAAGEMYVMAGVVPTVRRGPRVPYVPTKSRTMAVFAHAGWVSRTKVVWAVRKTFNAVHSAKGLAVHEPEPYEAVGAHVESAKQGLGLAGTQFDAAGHQSRVDGAPRLRLRLRLWFLLRLVLLFEGVVGSVSRGVLLFSLICIHLLRLRRVVLDVIFKHPSLLASLVFFYIGAVLHRGQWCRRCSQKQPSRS